MPPVASALNHLSLAMNEIKKLGKNCGVKAPKTRTIGTSPMKEKKVKAVKTRTMATMTAPVKEKKVKCVKVKSTSTSTSTEPKKSRTVGTSARYRLKKNKPQPHTDMTGVP